MATAEFDISGFDEIFDAIRNFEGSVEGKINEILHKQAPEEVKKSILALPDFPVSGRTWKGKKKAAKSGNPFTEQTYNLGFTVRSRKQYNYLYFPDDGSNTTKHAGNQNFMGRGLDKSIDTILDQVLVAFDDSW